MIKPITKRVKFLFESFTVNRSSGDTSGFSLVGLNKVIVSTVVFLLSFTICNNGFSQERMNPFKSQFPVIKEVREIVDEAPIQFIQEEKEVFNVSLYRLQGVVWGEYTSKAILNDRIYGIGDQLGKAEIIRINKEGVAVNFQDEEYVIVTNNMFIKRNGGEVYDDEL